MSETCPVCSDPVATGDTACPTCWFKLLGT